MVHVSYLSLLILLVLCVMVAVVVAAVIYLASRGARPNRQDNPNLRPCPDCGKQISIRATTCPHCGGPVKGL